MQARRRGASGQDDGNRNYQKQGDSRRDPPYATRSGWRLRDLARRLGRGWGRRWRRSLPIGLTSARNRYPRPGDCFNEPRILRRVPQGVPDLADSLVQAVIEVDDGLRPEPVVQLRPGDQLAGTFQQQGQDAERLFLAAAPVCRTLVEP